MEIVFKFTDKQEKQLVEWVKKHQKKCKIKDFGAIGGGTIYLFTPTGLGPIMKVRCACGKEINLTDYENW